MHDIFKSGMIAVRRIVTELKDKHSADFIIRERINGYDVDLQLLFPDFEISNRDKAAILLFVEILNEFPDQKTDLVK